MCIRYLVTLKGIKLPFQIELKFLIHGMKNNLVDCIQQFLKPGTIGLQNKIVPLSGVTTYSLILTAVTSAIQYFKHFFRAEYNRIVLVIGYTYDFHIVRLAHTVWCQGRGCASG